MKDIGNRNYFVKIVYFSIEDKTQFIIWGSACSNEILQYESKWLVGYLDDTTWCKVHLILLTVAKDYGQGISFTVVLGYVKEGQVIARPETKTLDERGVSR